jgi:methionine synthase II (cobalamin-independent)
MNVQGIATGIGSLPLKEASDAVDLVFKYVPLAPFWPQLPKRNIREGMVAQYSEGLPGLKVTDDGLEFDQKTADEALEGFYEHIIAMDLDHFRISEPYAAGLYAFLAALKERDLSGVRFIKCHVTGPFTFAASITNADGVALIHDEVLMQAMVKGLIMKALWQIKLFSSFGKPIIVFFDEPYLAGFGSAFTALTREAAVKTLEEFSGALKAPDVLVGVHCCGNTDWSIFTDVKTIDIINFDAFSYMDKFALYGQDLAGFLKRGGLLCWGLVPTQDFHSGITCELLTGKLRSGIDALVQKGASRALVSEQLLVSPSCGLGTLQPGAAEQIFSVLGDLSAYIRKGS